MFPTMRRPQTSRVAAAPELAKNRSGAWAKMWPYLFLAPAMAIFALFSYYPLGDTVYRSMQASDLFGRPAGFVGFENYMAMLQSSEFLATLLRTLVYVVGSVGLKLLVGLAIALPLSSRLVGTVVVRPMVLIPMAFSTAVAGVVFKMMYQPEVGTFDQIFRVFGWESPGWLTDGSMAMLSVILTDLWVGIGLTVLLLISALDSIPGNVMEAASLDGVTWAKKIWYMQLPLITPTLFFIVITQTIAALRQFTLINILTEGGPNGATTTLTYDLYNIAFASNASFGESAARGVVLMVIVGVISWLQFRLGERRVNY